MVHTPTVYYIGENYIHARNMYSRIYVNKLFCSRDVCEWGKSICSALSQALSSTYKWIIIITNGDLGVRKLAAPVYVVDVVGQQAVRPQDHPKDECDYNNARCDLCVDNPFTRNILRLNDEQRTTCGSCIRTKHCMSKHPFNALSPSIVP